MINGCVELEARPFEPHPHSALPLVSTRISYSAHVQDPRAVTMTNVRTVRVSRFPVDRNLLRFGEIPLLVVTALAITLLPELIHHSQSQKPTALVNYILDNANAIAFPTRLQMKVVIHLVPMPMPLETVDDIIGEVDVSSSDMATLSDYRYFYHHYQSHISSIHARLKHTRLHVPDPPLHFLFRQAAH